MNGDLGVGWNGEGIACMPVSGRYLGMEGTLYSVMWGKVLNRLANKSQQNQWDSFPSGWLGVGGELSSRRQIQVFKPGLLCVSLCGVRSEQSFVLSHFFLLFLTLFI